MKGRDDEVSMIIFITAKDIMIQRGKMSHVAMGPICI